MADMQENISVLETELIWKVFAKGVLSQLQSS
jgi:hypothetical protein